jgi:hypothetical protein
VTDEEATRALVEQSDGTIGSVADVFLPTPGWRLAAVLTSLSHLGQDGRLVSSASRVWTPCLIAARMRALDVGIAGARSQQVKVAGESSTVASTYALTRSLTAVWPAGRSAAMRWAGDETKSPSSDAGGSG